MNRSMLLVSAVMLTGGCLLTEVDGTPVDVSFSGKVKTDAAYDTDQNNSTGSYVIYMSDSPTGGDNFTITPLETRLAMNMKKGEALTGKVEVDFYSAAASATATGAATLPENKTTVMLRHAFVKAQLTESQSIIAGQTSDVFSPIVPSTLNYSVAWGIGNMGYRRPQLRYELAASGLSVQVAAASALDAQDAASPHLQGRLGYTLKNADQKILTVGISGVSGWTDAARTEKVEAGALDLVVALGKMFSLSMEYHSGRNLSDYLGGILQGTNINDDEIGTTGYWVQLKAKLTDKICLNIGMTSDDPEQDDLAASLTNEMKDLNTSTFINIRAKLNESLEAGLEFMNCSTTYFDGTNETKYNGDRYQFSLIYKF
jgi:hypothetical protein